MPLPNEHSCSLADESDFQSFASQDDEIRGRKVRRILGKRGGTIKATQSVRFPLSSWPGEKGEQMARDWCKKQGGKFEKAKPRQENIAEIIKHYPKLTEIQAESILEQVIDNNSSSKAITENDYWTMIKRYAEQTDDSSQHGNGTHCQLSLLLNGQLDVLMAQADNVDSETGEFIKQRPDFLRSIAEAAGVDFSVIESVVNGNNTCPEEHIIDALSQTLQLDKDTLNNAKFCGQEQQDPLEGKETGKGQQQQESDPQDQGPQLLQMKHSFDWAMPMDIDPREHMLIKGVAMQEGKAKRGEIMTKENITYAAGAMSMAAQFGVSILNIDHHHDSLPEQYINRYGAELADPYPPGGIIDAAVEQNNLENGSKVNQVEFIGYVKNPKVYEMIRQGRFKGTSVEDMFRAESCDCGDKHGKCSCTIEGSHFIHLALVLEEVPNSDGTWVAPVTQEDIEKWRKNAEKKSPEIISLTHAKSANKARQHMTPRQFLKYNEVKLYAVKSRMKNELADYLDDTGSFRNGMQGIMEFLIEEKELPETTARDIAGYLFEHPDALNQQQFEHMSGEDLIAWFRHIEMQNLQQKLDSIEQKLDRLGTQGKHTQSGTQNHSSNSWPYKFKKKHELGSTGLVEKDPSTDSSEKTQQETRVAKGSYIDRYRSGKPRSATIRGFKQRSKKINVADYKSSSMQ